jgi:hypothetical protein
VPEVSVKVGAIIVLRSTLGKRRRFWTVGRPTGSYPETGFGEITGDVLEADFGSASLRVLSGPSLPLSPSTRRNRGEVQKVLAIFLAGQ